VLDRRHVELEYKAVNTSMDAARLSTEVKISRGNAPARGFENPSSGFYMSGRSDPMSSIAAARQEVQMLFELTQDIGRSLSVTETLSVVGARLKRLVPTNRSRSMSVATRNWSGLRERRKLPAVLLSGDSHRTRPVGMVADNNKPILNGNRPWRPAT